MHALAVVKNTTGSRTASATPVQKSVKNSPLTRPSRIPPRMEQSATERVKSVKKARGRAVRARFVARKA